MPDGVRGVGAGGGSADVCVRRVYMDRRTRTRHEMRLERRLAGLYFAAIAGLLLLSLWFWDALLAALEAAAW